LPLNIVSSGSFTRHDLPTPLATHFVGDHMEGALSGEQSSMYSVVAIRELLMVTAKYAASMVFHRTGEGGFGYNISISNSAGVFTAELSALFVTMRHIGEVIQSQKNA
jgi:hypothetical protein